MEVQQVVPAASAPLKVLLSVEEAAEALGMGRTFVYALLTRREIVSVKVGRTRRVPVKALHDYVERLVNQEGGSYVGTAWK